MPKIRPEVTKKAFKEHIKPITSNPLNAIIELIANAYDAGATELDITWPLENTLYGENESRTAIFKDNGQGISSEEFPEIWKELSYNRIQNQGNTVSFTVDGEEVIREVYGKNGKGRHSPFAFSNKYCVETIKDGKKSVFDIEMDSKGFSIEEVSVDNVLESNGTEIRFDVDSEKILEIDVIRETIATRFLKDDSFEIILNDERINLTDIDDENIVKIKCSFEDNEIEILQLESTTKTRYNKFHGLSWKIGNRLIEDKTWNNILDGRKKISKRFNYIINADILKDYTNENMTSFIKDSFVDDVKNAVNNCIKKSMGSTLKKEYDETKRNILMEELPEVRKLSNLNQDELGQFISNVQESCPDINYKYLKAVTEIFIKLKNTSTGYGLFKQLSELSINDFDELSEILSEWDIHSAKIVLDEIKWRINLINELELKINDPNTDELHELQPLFEKGLWIFGPEYESIEFTSNKGLSTVIREIFKSQDINVENPRLRPDFVVIPDDKSIGIHSSDSFDEQGDVNGIDKILIVEIKKGGFNIALDEIQQTQRYVQQLIDGNHITPDMKVIVYVLGSTVSVDSQTMGDNVEILPKPYNIILQRAKKRLFNLDKKIREVKEIEDDVNDEIVREVLQQRTLNG